MRVECYVCMEADKNGIGQETLSSHETAFIPRHVGELLSVKPKVTDSSQFVWDLLGFSLENPSSQETPQKWVNRGGWSPYR